jgi:hypothetical protein
VKLLGRRADGMTREDRKQCLIAWFIAWVATTLRNDDYYNLAEIVFNACVAG